MLGVPLFGSPFYPKCGPSKTPSVSPSPVTELRTLKRSCRYAKVSENNQTNADLLRRIA